jgi:hypothetical protein
MIGLMTWCRDDWTDDVMIGLMCWLDWWRDDVMIGLMTWWLDWCRDDWNVISPIMTPSFDSSGVICSFRLTTPLESKLGVVMFGLMTWCDDWTDDVMIGLMTWCDDWTDDVMIGLMSWWLDWWRDDWTDVVMIGLMSWWLDWWRWNVISPIMTPSFDSSGVTCSFRLTTPLESKLGVVMISAVRTGRGNRRTPDSAPLAAVASVWTPFMQHGVTQELGLQQCFQI